MGEYDTAGSRVITDLSTDAACGCLTSQIGRDVVLSAKYGRTQKHKQFDSMVAGAAVLEADTNFEARRRGTEHLPETQRYL